MSFSHKLTYSQAFFLQPVESSLKPHPLWIRASILAASGSKQGNTKSISVRLNEDYFVFQSEALVVFSCFHGDDGFLPSSIEF